MKIKIPFVPAIIELSKVQPIGKVVNRNYNKVFVIGFGKTGTTALRQTLLLCGFKIGNQQIASMLLEDYANKRWDRINKLVDTADAFQDVPFSLPGTYKILDKTFPNSKFILSVRTNSNEWYNSLLNFHAKKVGKPQGSKPTEQDLNEVSNIYKGWMLDAMHLIWNYPKIPLYDEHIYKSFYRNHILDVQSYFSGRENDLITINVKNSHDFRQLMSFLNIETSMTAFPLLKKT